MSVPPVPRIMLVEDDPQFVYLIRRYAGASGCLLIQPDSVDQALPLARKELPDLILLDVALNGKSGWEVLTALKADPVTRKVPLILCSAAEVAIHGWEEYAEGCLLKPVMFEDFLAALMALMGSYSR